MAKNEELLPELDPAIPISKRVRDVYPKGKSGINIIRKGRRTKLDTLVKRSEKKKKE